MGQQEITAFSPASVGNAGPGFDLLGHSLQGPGDRVSVRRIESREIVIEAISGCVTELPRDARSNTAGKALLSLQAALDLPHGFALRIHKGIPLGSGLGGSAASCVAALVAANALLPQPLERHELYPHALAGEAAASGSAHGDNVAPMLLGGLVLASSDRLTPIPVPDTLYCALVHPDQVLETRRAREILQGTYLLADVVHQMSHLAQLISGCYRQDIDLIRCGLADVLVEPRRAALIPGFHSAKQAAMESGALGASISGAGPSIFAWFEGEEAARQGGVAMQATFSNQSIASQLYVSPVAGPAAEVLS
ncbi:MAG: homoserine kinase [Wenzhouxiangellaceae bacterium]